MLVTFNENGKTYEVQNEHVSNIFDDVKAAMSAIYEKYRISDMDLIIAVTASECIASSVMQGISDRYGVDSIVEILNAKEVIEDKMPTCEHPILNCDGCEDYVFCPLYSTFRKKSE